LNSALSVLVFILSLCSLVVTPAYSSESITGQVVEVADGDTITILTQNQGELKIRLSGVDCPESFQIHGDKAKQFTSSMVAGKRVRIEPETIDQHGRTVAMVLLNGENLNEQIVGNGHGWVYRKYCTAAYCNDWLQLEDSARAGHVGLWGDENPQPPWEWRAEQRSKNGDEGSFSKIVSTLKSSILTVGGGSANVYHGNRRSHVFHSPSCADYNCKNCTLILGSIQEAMNSGFRPHRECVTE
jgi:micrococcal nuclease